MMKTKTGAQGIQRVTRRVTRKAGVQGKEGFQGGLQEERKYKGREGYKADYKKAKAQAKRRGTYDGELASNAEGPVIDELLHQTLNDHKVCRLVRSTLGLLHTDRRTIR